MNSLPKRFGMLPLVILSACVLEPVAGPEDLDAWIQTERTNAQQKVQIAPLPEAPVRTAISNEAPTDIFDPARSRPANQGGVKNIDKRLVQQYPLVGIAVEELSYAGYFMQKGQRVALIRVGDRLVRSHIGDLIGVRAGRITKITDDQIQFAEQIQNDIGKWVQRTGTIELTSGEKNAG
jgi:Tfp pilus assembly protein PilP